MSSTVDPSSLNSLTVADLKTILKKYNVPSSGTKVELVRKLNTYIRTHDIDISTLIDNKYMSYRYYQKLFNFTNAADILDGDVGTLMITNMSINKASLARLLVSLIIHYPQIHAISMAHSTLSSKVVHLFSELYNVDTLNIEYSNYIIGSGLELLAVLPRLEHFSLKNIGWTSSSSHFTLEIFQKYLITLNKLDTFHMEGLRMDNNIVEQLCIFLSKHNMSDVAIIGADIYAQQCQKILGVLSSHHRLKRLNISHNKIFDDIYHEYILSKYHYLTSNGSGVNHF